MKLNCYCCGRFPIAGLVASQFSAEAVEAALELESVEQAPLEADATGYYFYNGDILPMTGEADGAQCLLTNGESIVYVGDVKDCPPLPKGVASVDLHGKCLIPGMIDAHMHVVGTAMDSLCVDVSPAIAAGVPYTTDLVLATLQKALVDVKPVAPWLFAVGFDPSQMTDWQDLNVRRFESLKSKFNVGVVVQSGSGHLSFVNQTALEWAGITKDTPDPEGGYIGRFQDGTPSGILVEMPAQVLLKGAFLLHPLPFHLYDPATLRLAVIQVFKDALAVGLTTVNDAAIGIALGYVPELSVLNVVRATMVNKPRLASAMYLNEWDPDKLPDAFTNGPDFSNDMFFKQAVKLFADGSNQGVTGFQTVPYTQWALSRTTDYSSAHTSGNSDLSVADLSALMKQAILYGWQIMAHANGDQAVANVIAAYSEALNDKPDTLRHRIEHSSLTNDDDLNHMARLGLSPSFLIAHVATWGNVLSNILGQDRTSQMLDRCKSALSRGLKISLHSDHPVTPLGPLQMVQDAVTRLTQDGSVLNPDECLTPYQALRAVTADAAWACRIEDKVGTLEAGKLADLVVLQHSPLKVPATSISSIPVKFVYVAGKPVIST